MQAHINISRPARALIVLFLSFSLAGPMYSQIGIGLSAGTNISKIRFVQNMGPYYSYTKPGMGFSTALEFSHIVSDKFSYRAELGYQMFNCFAKVGGSSAHNPNYFEGNYKMDFISLAILPRFNLKKRPEFGLIAGLSLNKQMSLTKEGTFHFDYGKFGDPDYTGEWGEREVNEKTSVRNNYVFLHLGIDYRIDFGENLNIFLELSLFGGTHSFDATFLRDLELLAGIDFSVIFLYTLN